MVALERPEPELIVFGGCSYDGHVSAAVHVLHLGSGEWVSVRRGRRRASSTESAAASEYSLAWEEEEEEDEEDEDEEEDEEGEYEEDEEDEEEGGWGEESGGELLETERGRAVSRPHTHAHTAARTRSHARPT